MKNQHILLRFCTGVLLIVLTFSTGGCVKKIALKKISASLTAEGSTVFTGDNDPLLIKDALPFALKTYESLLTSMPNDANMYLATGKSYCMYAYAFIQAPSDTLGDESIDEKESNLLRAKKMYHRAYIYLKKAAIIKHPDFNAFFREKKYDDAISLFNKSDTTLMYWTALAMMGEFTCDKFDISVAVKVPFAVKLMKKILAINENFGNGSVHDFFISYYGGMPASMGGSKEKALEHFNRAIELNRGENAGTYISLATTVSVAKQDLKQFKELLNKALEINPSKNRKLTLVNTINQIKAKWLLRNTGNYFLSEENGDLDNE